MHHKPHAYKFLTHHRKCYSNAVPRTPCWYVPQADAIPLLPDVNTLTQFIRLLRLPVSCPPREPAASGTLGSHVDLWAPVIPQSVHTHCSSWTLCSGSLIPWRVPWSQSLPDEVLRMNRMHTAFWNCSYLAEWIHSIELLTKVMEAKSKGWVYSWKGI